ncbi:hypothetical protein E4H12_12830 [Candidatus Thorarchaeota archaeon]|nr:MAG: hypothetical protein E4H12_12830 [Candidatus Thorarchaeota archaeon]
MNVTRFEGFDVVAYDLSEYAPLLQPFCEWLVSPEGEQFTLGDDKEIGKLSVWEVESDAVRLMSAIFDAACLQFLDEEHPKFKGKGKNYIFKKDAWLTTPNTQQHVRIHTHLPPYIRADDVGDLITVFYPYMDETIGIDNGPFELFRSPHDEKPVHIWAPKVYSLLLMTPETWHRARPFTGRRYSLATDIKVFPA